MSICLIGYRGSGKTSIGRRLAEKLALPFVDTDDLLIQRAGKSIREIFAEAGEQAFRDLEADIVREACQLPDHVISFGGGAVLRAENREAIRAAGRVIYLHCTPAVLYQRIRSDAATAANRPNLTSAGGLAEVEHLLAVRDPLYRETMTFKLDVTDLTVDEAVAYIARHL